VLEIKPRYLGCEIRSVVIILTELSGNYFDLGAGSCFFDDRGAKNFDKKNCTEIVILLVYDAASLLDLYPTFRDNTMVSSSRVEMSM
jgi:hypothetical protein